MKTHSYLLLNIPCETQSRNKKIKKQNKTKPSFKNVTQSIPGLWCHVNIPDIQPYHPIALVCVSHRLCLLGLRLLGEVGALQHGAHDGEALASLELAR